MNRIQLLDHDLSLTGTNDGEPDPMVAGGDCGGAARVVPNLRTMLTVALPLLRRCAAGASAAARIIILLVFGPWVL